jgi:UDP-N-acetylmuramoyl-tripeptide--D-alanyl-D-alanine ligase
MKLSDAVQVCGGVYRGPKEDLSGEITGISTDTRAELQGKLFIPLKGPRFDAHDFIGAVWEKGAAAALSERDVIADDVIADAGIVIQVPSTLQALADLAAAYRERFPILVTAVTGSAGKTTTKDMIASVLSQKYKTLKTEGNLNNEVGLPRMVFQLDETHEAAVLEMGMNHKGEIHRLSRIARPDIAVITNIGDAHMENLGSRRAILEAKVEIFDFMQPGGVCILNGDDPLLRSLEREPGFWEKIKEKKMIFYGLSPDKCPDNRPDDCPAKNTVWADDIRELGTDGARFRIHRAVCQGGHCGESSFEVHIRLPGRHMIANALAAAAVGWEMGVPPNAIRAGLETFTLSQNRMEIIRTPIYTILNDVYNANPSSMEAALDALALMGSSRRKAAVLGDMLELGVQAAALHEAVGRYAAQTGIDLLIGVGEWAAQMLTGFCSQKTEEQRAVSFHRKEECAARLEALLQSLLQPGDLILIKASRGMAFETLVKQLVKEARYGQ